jgi:hypothetical protein
MNASRLAGVALSLCSVVSMAGMAAAVPGPDLRPPSWKPPAAQPGFRAPGFSAEYAQQLRQLPDWNGSWYMLGGYLFDPSNAWLPPNDDEAFDTGPLEGSVLRNVPYKPAYQALYDRTVAEALQGRVNDPVGDCRQPHGMPRELGGIPGGPEIIVLPGQVRMTYYWFNATRRIYTDGRQHPQGVDLVPSFMGHSTGHWEDDTLVVDTVGMHPGVYDRTGAPHSGEVHVAERIRMIAPDILEARITITDPVMLTRPWEVVRHFRRIHRQPQTDGAYCEGGRIEMVDGVQTLVLPGEKAAASDKGETP